MKQKKFLEDSLGPGYLHITWKLLTTTFLATEVFQFQLSRLKILSIL